MARPSSFHARLTAAALLLAAALGATEHPTSVAVWPGYMVELPAGHCAELTKGPDFDVMRVRDRRAAADAFLVGIYAGFAPNFEPECARPTKRKWTSNRLAFESVRGLGGCAELLVRDPTNSERGVLHIWYGPGARSHGQLAERLVASIRPAPMPMKDATNPPPCD